MANLIGATSLYPRAGTGGAGGCGELQAVSAVASAAAIHGLRDADSIPGFLALKARQATGPLLYQPGNHPEPSMLEGIRGFVSPQWCARFGRTREGESVESAEFVNNPLASPFPYCRTTHNGGGALSQS